MSQSPTSQPAEPSAAEANEFRRRLRQVFESWSPHTKALGVRTESIERDGVLARLGCRPEFIGDIQRGVIHTGVIASLIDSVAGCCVSARIGRPQTIATLDMRIDYLHPSYASSDLHCRAECYRVSHHIAFVRSSVWQDDPEQPVATSLATFMRVVAASAQPL